VPITLGSLFRAVSSVILDAFPQRSPSMASGFVSGIRKAFPFISAAASLGGPFGVMAAAAVGKAIGADKPPQGTEDSITNALATAMANPDQLLALKKAEQDFQVKMNEMGLDLEKIAADDRASARAMQVD
jgi:hypothetical protein